jgi:hypothetical protein
MANEIKYKGKTIEVKFPSGMFEYYSDKEGRFLKFDTLKATKESIDKEGKLKTESIVTKKISLNELRTLVKQVIKEEESNRISVFDYVDDNSNDGYATALYDKNHKLIDDYVDPNDYPDIYVSERGAILTGEYKGGSLGIHSGGIKDLDYIEKHPKFKSRYD